MCESYNEWKHCITVKCGIPLTEDYIAKRIKALSDNKDPMTARFVTLYGDSYRLQTVRWFEQARKEVGGEHQKTG